VTNRGAGRPTRAAIYCRISLAKDGDTVKVDDQERICRDLAAARGWSVEDQHVYKDNGKSAWQHNRKRPGWDALFVAIERREIDAIIVYHGDRLIRQSWDLELLLRISRERRIQLAAPTGNRDLSNDDDQFILRIEAAAASREVASTSRRLKAMFDRRAQAGYVRLGGRGGRAFGFEPDGLTIRHEDADMIREAARRIVGGEPVSAICRDLNARGYRTTTGGEFGHGSLSKLMQRPRLAGLVSHHGQIVGPAAWPAILSREEWEAVCAALSGKAQMLGFTPTNDRRYLLSGIALCGTCGATLAARHNVRGKTLLGYGCIAAGCPKKVHRAMHHLDPYVSGYVVQILNDPRLRQAMMPEVSPHLVAELEQIETRKRSLFAALADADVEFMDQFRRITLPTMDARIAEIQAALSSVLAVKAVDGMFGITRKEFAVLPLSRRRAVVRAVVRVTVLPSGRRGPLFDPSAVRLEPAYPG
jgi:DNA invertase Pin-like site-specific DNA recombinase